MEKESRHRVSIDYKAVFEHSLDAIIICTPQGKILSANPAACKMFRMTEDELMKIHGGSLLDITQEEREKIRAELNSKGEIRRDYRMIRKGGEKFYASISSRFYEHKKNEVINILVIRDITDKLDILNEKIKSEQFLHNVINTAPVIFYILDMEGRFTYTAGSGFSGSEIKPGQHVNYSAYDLYGHLIFTLSDGMSITGKEVFERIYRGETIISTYENKGVHYANRMAPIQDVNGKQSGIVGVAVNITERIHSTNLLMQKEANLRSLIENSEGPIWSVDRNFCLIDGNAKYFQQFSRVTGVMVKPGDNIVEPLPTDLQEEWRSYYKSGLEGRRFKIETTTRYPLELEYRRYSFNPICIDDSSIIGVNITGQDITDLVMARNSLQSTNDHLRTLLIRVKNVIEVERTSIAKDLHDDLGQKLTIISFGLSSLIRNKGITSKDVSDKLNEISLLVADALESTRRISKGLRPVMLEDLGLKASLDWQVKEFSKTTGIVCSLICRGGEIPVNNDLALNVFRIVQEALSNAARHSGAAQVKVLLEIRNNRLNLVIKDNGKGIDPKKINNVFSTGLTGMKERALMSNGSLKIAGNKGKGTSVIASFPL